MIGIVLGAGTTLTDRCFRKIPNKIAVVLYIAAVALIITGMILSRKSEA